MTKGALDHKASDPLASSHTPEAIRARLGMPKPPSLLRDSVLGATDGCVTTFAVVAGAIGGGLSDAVVIILGFSNLLADGFSMAAGNYLGARAANEELEKARDMERLHIERQPEGEKEEVRQIFAAKGFQGDLLERIVSVIADDKRLWVETMVSEEHKLANWDAKPKRAAWAVFGSFCIAGTAPLLPFILPGLDSEKSFLASCLATGATFVLIGYVKGRIVNGSAWKSGLLTLLLGGSAALLAYGVGFALSRLGFG